MPFGPFISQEEKDNINRSLQQNHGYQPRPVKGPAPAPRPTSRYSSGKAGGAGQFDPKEINLSRENRQGGSANKRNRGSRANTSKPQETVSKKPISTAGRSRYSSGVDRSEKVEKPETKQSRSRRTRYSGGVKAVSTAADTPDVPVRPSQPSGWTTDKTQLDALLGSGGSDKRMNANGVVQTGTNTGFKPMTLAGLQAEDGILGKLGLTVADPYSSNQLPTTGSSPYQADSKPVAFDAQSGAGPTGAKQQQLSANLFASGGALDFEVPEGGKSVVSGDKSGTNWLNRTMTDNSDPNIARRRAFLDAESSMAGLRAVEAQKGMVYAGGKHHMLNPNRGQEGENDFFEITKDQARGYKSGRLGAQDLLNTYVANGGAKTPTEGEFTEAKPDIPSHSEMPMNMPAASEFKPGMSSDEFDYDEDRPLISDKRRM